eukprot:6775666-Prymnesium_polylepis.1
MSVGFAADPPRRRDKEGARHQGRKETRVVQHAHYRTKLCCALPSASDVDVLLRFPSERGPSARALSSA